MTGNPPGTTGNALESTWEKEKPSTRNATGTAEMMRRDPQQQNAQRDPGTEKKPAKKEPPAATGKVNVGATMERPKGTTAGVVIANEKRKLELEIDELKVELAEGNPAISWKEGTTEKKRAEIHGTAERRRGKARGGSR
jgi:hypothetical protein